MALAAFGREDRPEYREDWGDGDARAALPQRPSPHPPPPPREQCTAAFGGKVCNMLAGHDGFHQHWAGFSKQTLTWADASTDPALMRKAIEEHADMLYSLGAP